MSSLQLPDVILERIFRMLSMDDWRSCEKTCRRFWVFFARIMWPRVKRLDINKTLSKRFFVDEHRLNLNLLRYLFLKCVALRSVSIDPLGKNKYHFQAVCWISHSCLEQLCNICPLLTELCFRSCVFSSFYVFKYLQHLPPTLKALKVEWCRVDESGHDGTVDGAVSSILSCLHKLETFSLRGTCYGTCRMTDRSLERLPTSLKIIDLSENFETRIANLNWSRFLSRLQELHLERVSVTSHDLQCLCQSCPDLKSLTLAYADQISDFSTIAVLRELRGLKLDGNRTHVIDDALAKICNGCTRLVSLSLDCCCALTVSGIKNLAKLPQLEFLNLNSIRCVNDECLETICSSCTHLSNLQIKYCKQLTIQGLLCLLKLSQLERVGLSGQDAVDAQLLDQLRSLRTLKCIETENCQHLK
ncbi:unnamed protein product [Soboliphyme baturini]|uniref:F-box domain-containing protein n=1 Tax=Soboliphyme baturini TaxID=241478 RepID=A0A183J9S4_9BILA|nr:unnamed protein product [Soboliphyme baturini]